MSRLYGVFLMMLVMNQAALADGVDATETDPNKIMSAVEARDGGNNSKSVMTMEVVDDKGRTRSRTLVSLMMKFNEGRKQLMTFKSPADVAGTGLLSIDYDAGERQDDQWLFLPSMKKTTRITSGEKSGSFMGTDLSYADMTQSDPKDFNYTLIAADKVVDGESCWVIEARPKSERAKLETGYLKSKIWVSKSKLLPLQIKSWVLKGRKLKYIKFDELKQVDGIWIAHKIQAKTVRNKQVESTTTITFSEYAVNLDGVHDEMFTQMMLRRGL